jgi:hypothetical protein
MCNAAGTILPSHNYFHSCIAVLSVCCSPVSGRFQTSLVDNFATLALCSMYPPWLGVSFPALTNHHGHWMRRFHEMRVLGMGRKIGGDDRITCAWIIFNLNQFLSFCLQRFPRLDPSFMTCSFFRLTFECFT